VIEKSALIALRKQTDGESLLLVKEEGDSHWLLPGGRLEEGEAVEDALVREVAEELSTGITSITPLGVVDGETADGIALRIHLFLGSLEGKPIPNGELTELRWIDRLDIATVQEDLTPITVKKIFPLLARHRLW
jgi:8-oxo-dGTP pyrophosphatase MutT (NUDIX family)